MMPAVCNSMEERPEADRTMLHNQKQSAAFQEGVHTEQLSIALYRTIKHECHNEQLT